MVSDVIFPLTITRSSEDGEMNYVEVDTIRLFLMVVSVIFEEVPRRGNGRTIHVHQNRS